MTRSCRTMIYLDFIFFLVKVSCTLKVVFLFLKYTELSSIASAATRHSETARTYVGSNV